MNHDMVGTRDNGRLWHRRLLDLRGCIRLRNGNSLPRWIKGGKRQNEKESGDGINSISVWRITYVEENCISPLRASLRVHCKSIGVLRSSPSMPSSHELVDLDLTNKLQYHLITGCVIALL